MVECFVNTGSGGDLCDAVLMGSLESTAYLHLLVVDLGDLELHTACLDPLI